MWATRGVHAHLIPPTHSASDGRRDGEEGSEAGSRNVSGDTRVSRDILDEQMLVISNGKTQSTALKYNITSAALLKTGTTF
ncbi:hypothetical protein E2C01_081393 [Portunus trituberculatus]|uniref:Uncharacterized protein n=1 Tax=Portunus trituberculatus TaxID=210409 RepID=A0A5B7IRU1_PORTR|nr:hypothetical protein [Portunus trituberculatus]